MVDGGRTCRMQLLKSPYRENVFEFRTSANQKPKNRSRSPSNATATIRATTTHQARAMTTNPPAAAPLHKPTPEELQEAVSKVISEVRPMPCHVMFSFGPFEINVAVSDGPTNKMNLMEKFL